MLWQVQVSCRYAKEKSFFPLVLIRQDKCQVLAQLKNSATDLSTTKSVVTTLQTVAAFEFFLHPLIIKTVSFLHERMKFRSHLPKDGRPLGIPMNLI